MINRAIRSFINGVKSNKYCGASLTLKKATKNSCCLLVNELKWKLKIVKIQKEFYFLKKTNKYTQKSFYINFIQSKK